MEGSAEMTRRPLPPPTPPPPKWVTCATCRHFHRDTPCWARRLTERELFRLMDVDEPDIDTLLNAGISNTQLAKLAGNSIVTACMYFIFKNLFIDTTNPNPQLTIFDL